MITQARLHFRFYPSMTSPALIGVVAMQAGDSPLQLPPKPQETSGKSRSNPLMFVLRLLLGSTAGFYYFVLPVYMWIKNKIWPKSLPGF